MLVRHYGFTEQELDVIPSAALRAGINYDVKYRMGGEFATNPQGSPNSEMNPLADSPEAAQCALRVPAA